jgi:hypothetical protein
MSDLYLDYWLKRILLATQASRRAENADPIGLFHGLGLVGGGNQDGRGSGRADASQVLIFEDQGPLKDHLDLSAGFDVDVGAAGEEADEAGGSGASGQAGKTAGQRMPTLEAA